MAVKPSLALIPSGVKANKVYSVLPADGVGDFDFSRSGSATRINKDGLIETVDSNVPRLNYPLIDGVVSGCPSLLLEPARTNLITYSENYNTWNKAALTNSSVTEVNPQGTTSTQKITQTSSGGFVWFPRTFTGNETFSVFVKKDSSNFARLYAANNSVYFDIVNGTITNETGSEITYKSIIDYGNGWFRISISVNSTASNVRIYPASSGTSSNGTNSMFVWGAQLEEGSYPTSYIPTNGGAVTRSAEAANNSGNANTFNDSEGVLFADIAALATSPTRVITLGDGTSLNRIQFYYNSSNVLNGNLITNGSGQVTNFIYNGDANLFNRCALKYKVNDFAFWVNGFKIAVDTNGITPTGLNELTFDNGSNTADFYGNTKQIQYFDTALTDAELEKLTSYDSFRDMAIAGQYKTY